MNEESQRLQAQLERLPEKIREYYGVYFSELRSELARPDLFSEAVPGFLKGHKRILTVGGRDGVVVAHFPVELEITVSDRGSGGVLLRFTSEQDAVEDSYEFVAPFDLPVSELVELISDGEDVGIEISPGVPWGVKGFAAPQQKIDATTGELAWQAPWTRLICADFSSLHFWEDTERAKREAREDLEPYVRDSGVRSRATAYEELDEVEAPSDIEEVGVRAGDRGVVVEVFERPRSALLVEYADPEGQTKALVTYSADLERILDVLPDRDRSSELDETSRRLSPVLTARVYA